MLKGPEGCEEQHQQGWGRVAEVTRSPVSWGVARFGPYAGRAALGRGCRNVGEIQSEDVPKCRAEETLQYFGCTFVTNFHKAGGFINKAGFLGNSGRSSNLGP